MSNPPLAGRPASPINFGGFKMAQALGTRQALLDAGRKVIHFYLGSDVIGRLQRLADDLIAMLSWRCWNVRT